VDGSGNLYIADTANARIRRVTASGAISTVAGNGTPGFSGDTGPAVAAELNGPTAVTLDGAGNLYILDSSNLRIRKVSTSGILTTVAGNGTRGDTGDGGLAIAAEIAPGHGLAADAAGNLYFTDPVNQRIRKVATDGTMTTIAGTTPLTTGGATGSTGDGGPALQAQLDLPSDVALDKAGNIYIAETTRALVISPGGIINSVPGAAGPANDPFLGINSVTVDTSGNIYVADTTSRIRKITPAGTVSIVAGPSGVVNYPANEPATGATFSAPSAVAADSQGNVLIADTNNSWIWRVSPGGTIAIAGHPVRPAAVAVDSKGNYYAAAQNEVFEATYTGSAPPTPVVVAGGGSATGDGGLATSAFLKEVSGVAVDAAGNLFIADMLDNRIRKVTPAGIITTVTGNGTSGFSGDNGPAANALVSLPRGIAFDSAGNLYIADSGNFRIRKISTAGVITTVAGGGTVSNPPPNPLPTGDGGLATSAILDFPTAVAIDAASNIYIADQSFSRIRKVTANGIINTVAGNGTVGYYGDGGMATAAAMNQPSGVAVDSAGNVYVAEQGNNIVRMLQPTNAPVLISAVLDAANERATAVTPGKIVVIYGAGLGPASTTLNAPINSAFGTQVAGTSVTFNGVSAPMIYASGTQVSAIVPYEMAGATTAQVVVTSQSGVSAAFSVAVAPSAPSFFSNNGSGAGQIAAVNPERRRERCDKSSGSGRLYFAVRHRRRAIVSCGRGWRSGDVRLSEAPVECDDERRGRPGDSLVCGRRADRGARADADRDTNSARSAAGRLCAG
jgi:sugar lactone lactonase YvrE